MMKKLTRMLALLLAMLLVVPAMAESTDVLATVNGTAVTRAEIDADVQSLESYYVSSYGFDFSDEESQKLLKQMAMEVQIQYILMDQQIVSMGLGLSEEEKKVQEELARADWANLLEEGLAYYGITAESTEEERAQMLLTVLADMESVGYNEESYVEETLLYAGYDKLQAEVVKDVAVTDDEVKAHFDSLAAADEVAYKNDAAAYEEVQQMNNMYLTFGMTQYVTPLYYQPAGYRGMSHILLEVDADILADYQTKEATYEEQQSALEEGEEVTAELMTAEEVEKARLAVIASVQDKIDEINQKLADGATFASLIPEYSTDPGMQDEASIAQGYPVHMDSIQWDPAFRDASFTVTNVGDITEPVVGSYGVHILQYVRDIPAGPIELNAVLAEELRANLLSTAQANVFNAALQTWKDAAVIEYSEEAKAFMSTAE